MKLQRKDTMFKVVAKSLTLAVEFAAVYIAGEAIERVAKRAWHAIRT